MSSLHAETAALSRMADRMAGVRQRVCTAASVAAQARLLEFDEVTDFLLNPTPFGDLSDPRAHGRFTRRTDEDGNVFWYDRYRRRWITDAEYRHLTGGD